MATILVLGASGHVGTAVATRLAQDHDVVGTRFSSRGAAPIRWLDVDLRDEAEIVNSLESLDVVPDVLVHCAGGGRWTDFQDLTVGAWDDVMAVSVRAPFIVARWLAARWTEGGRIIAVTAMPGVTSVAAPIHTASANAALTGMVRALANELGPRKIGVNAVMLGPLDGGLGHEVPKQMREDFERFSSLKRCGTAAEAAEVIAFCVGAPPSLTGSVFTANGGL